MCKIVLVVSVCVCVCVPTVLAIRKTPRGAGRDSSWQKLFLEDLLAHEDERDDLVYIVRLEQDDGASVCACECVAV